MKLLDFEFVQGDSFVLFCDVYPGVNYSVVILYNNNFVEIVFHVYSNCLHHKLYTNVAILGLK